MGECDAVFLALPHRAAMTQIDQWIERVKLVIDLAGDFRLDDTEVFERYYGTVLRFPQFRAA